MSYIISWHLNKRYPTMFGIKSMGWVTFTQVTIGLGENPWYISNIATLSEMHGIWATLWVDWAKFLHFALYTCLYTLRRFSWENLQEPMVGKRNKSTSMVGNWKSMVYEQHCGLIGPEGGEQWAMSISLVKNLYVMLLYNKYDAALQQMRCCYTTL